MNAPIDLVPLIKAASTDRVLRLEAVINWRMNAKNIFEHQERDGVRISDSGSCALELWAKVHNELDLPEDPDLQITRFDIGTLYGLWLACLTEAAISEAVPDWECVLEHGVALDGVPGHIDVLIRDKKRLEPIHVVDFKSTYWSGILDSPKKRADYQILQTASYAVAVGSPTFSILTVGPAVHRFYDKALGAMVTPPKMRQDDFVTADWESAARREIARLKTALLPTPPSPDAKEDWRCSSCRASFCSRNKNVLGQVAS